MNAPLLRLGGLVFRAVLLSFGLLRANGTPDVADTRLVSDPAISADRLAFAYANDLWIADREGGGVRRLTSHPGLESDPRFSPDGRWVAFTGRYEGRGNGDV